MATEQRWLEGVTVLDLTRYLAGPSCTRLLVELGADVIKIEQPPYGDPNRAGAPRINKRSGLHIQQNRGKRSVCLDIFTSEGQQIIRDLVLHVDVVVENFSPGVLDRRDLGYAALSQIKPDLVMASISGFGQTGPFSDRPCFDLIAQATAGIMHMTGEPDGPPTFVGLGMADTNAGVHAFGAIGHALFHRERTGRGTHLDIAMVDALFHMHDTAVTTVSMDDPKAPEAIRQGRNFNSLAPAGSFKSPDGWIIILCTEQQMPNLWNALGQPELANDERFRNNPTRLENRQALTDIIESWMANLGTDEAVIAALTEARVPHGPALTIEQAVAHPHFIERGTVRTVHDPLAGDVTIPGFPFRSSDELPPDEHHTAALGEHNAEVLQSLLGMSDDQIADLVDRGLLTSKPH
ncbi:MAG: CoA transferase [Acidimicrobiaceae bacterium]|nr:CoA transferase [Acidimicrobiaceae bacterium]MBT6443825.1 CoA transferase [Acidimicrobiaceae bacterium]